MKIIYLSGLLVALVPFLGLPSFWKTTLLLVLGFIIFIKGYLGDRSSKKEVEKTETSFEQNEVPLELEKEDTTMNSFEENKTELENKKP